MYCSLSKQTHYFFIFGNFINSEGHKVLFRIALTIFKMNEANILAVNDPLEVFQVVQVRLQVFYFLSFVKANNMPSLELENWYNLLTLQLGEL